MKVSRVISTSRSSAIRTRCETERCRILSTSLHGGGDLYSVLRVVRQDPQRRHLLNSNDDRRSFGRDITFNPQPAMDFNINLSYIRSLLALPLGDERRTVCCSRACAAFPGLTPSVDGYRALGLGNDQRASMPTSTTTRRKPIADARTTVNYNRSRGSHIRLTGGMDFRSSLAEVLSLPERS
jgi:hypothetical protein